MIQSNLYFQWGMKEESLTSQGCKSWGWGQCHRNSVYLFSEKKIKILYLDILIEFSACVLFDQSQVDGFVLYSDHCYDTSVRQMMNLPSKEGVSKLHLFPSIAVLATGTSITRHVEIGHQNCCQPTEGFLHSFQNIQPSYCLETFNSW